eukprot:6190293-Pleurochrysis_carterae.AAC.1
MVRARLSEYCLGVVKFCHAGDMQLRSTRREFTGMTPLDSYAEPSCMQASQTTPLENLMHRCYHQEIEHSCRRSSSQYLQLLIAFFLLKLLSVRAPFLSLPTSEKRGCACACV